ncbi:DNA-directed RNA polymerase III subunit RPC4 [Bienertia sinuspersici]
MDSDKPSSQRRKHRFAPKAPPQRKSKATAVPETQKDDSNEAEAQGNRRQRSKADNKAPVQATFIHGGKQSDAPQDGGLKQSTESDLMDLDDSTAQSESSLSTAGPSVIKESLADDLDPETEPWNYDSYYPTTLPWRRPYSGNPDILDEAEFGEAAAKSEYDENTIRPASELGLLNPDETSEKAKLLFLQFPQSLPAIKRSATAKGKEIEVHSGQLGDKGPMSMNVGAKGSRTTDNLQQTRSLEELPAGHMGKLRVYKSGAVKMKLGDTEVDLSTGTDCSFAQEVVAVDTEEKVCCSIGNLDKRAIVTPDVENLLNSDENDLS